MVPLAVVVLDVLPHAGAPVGLRLETADDKVVERLVRAFHADQGVGAEVLLEPGHEVRGTSARVAWRLQNPDDGAMKKLLVGAAAFGCRRDPSGADKTEIPDR